MRCIERMRYYQPFPAAIPLWKAGYPRVTHPSATKLKESLRKDLPVVPFDLHVLGTPPAFILSQDQTLMLKFFVSLRKRCDLKYERNSSGQNGLGFPFLSFYWIGLFEELMLIFRSLKSFPTIHVLWISSSWSVRIMFLASWARSLKRRPLVISWPQI